MNIAALWMIVAGSAMAGPCPDETVAVTVAGGTWDVHVDCMQHDSAANHTDRHSVLLVHGANHKARSYADWVAEVTWHADLASDLYRVYSVDLLGHGESDTPTGFTTVTLQDHAETIRQVLAALNADPDTTVEGVVGHSMGGMIIQLVEEQSLADNTKPSLDDLGVDRIMLMSPTLPDEVDWDYADHIFQYVPLTDVARLTAFSQEHGVHVAFPPDMFLDYFFTDCNGDPVNHAPSGYVIPLTSEVESLLAWMQMYGFVPSSWQSLVGGASLPTNRPSVREFALAAYDVNMVSSECDGYMLASELDDLQEHLTGTTAGRYHISDPQATHDAFYTVWTDDTLRQALVDLLQ